MIDEIGGAHQDHGEILPVPAGGAEGDAAGAGGDGERHAVRGVGGADVSCLHLAVPAVRVAAEAVQRRLQAPLRSDHRLERPHAVGVLQVRGRVLVAE